MSGVPALFRYVYDVWLPASEYVLDPRVLADFERYPEPVVDPENMTSEIWIPVASRQS
jgi:predicted transcriptional regulator YdeE